MPGPKSPCPPTLPVRARSQHDALLPSGSLEYFSFTGGGGGGAAAAAAVLYSAVQAGSSGFSTLLCVIKCGRYVRSLVIGAIYIGRHHFLNDCKKSGFMEELSTKEVFKGLMRK